MCQNRQGCVQSFMPSPSAFSSPNAPRNLRFAAACWIADIAGATLFAGSLAILLSQLSGEGSKVPISWLLAGIAASGLLRAAAQACATYQGQLAANAAKRSIRHHLYSALLPTAMARGRLIGEDLRTATDDIEAGEGYVARFLPLRHAAFLSPLIIASLVAFASWVSALILLATLIPFALGMALAGMAARTEADRQLSSLSRLSGLFVDRVRAMPVILGFAAEDRITRQLADASHEVAERTMQVLRIAFISSAVMEFFAALSVALVAVYCGFALLGLLPFPAPERLTLEHAFFALALAPEFYLGMRRLAAAYHDKQQGEAASSNINDTLEQAIAVPPTPHQTLLTIEQISVKNLVIEYADHNRIGPISACWNGPGLHVVSGVTGAGKSSLLHAIIGMTPIAQGELCANQSAIMGGSLNPHIGWAGQKPLLLPGTLRDNLTLGNTMADSDLKPLIVRLGLSDVAELRGLDLVIDHRGSGLSGGERRRLGLARAITSGRPLLLLDEPTADLDDAMAARIITLLRQLAQERLIIAATHDPALISIADSELNIA